MQGGARLFKRSGLPTRIVRNWLPPESLTIEKMNDLSDADSADILTEISRGVDKWLWFVEAHRQGG